MLIPPKVMAAKNTRRMNIVEKVAFAGTSESLQKKNWMAFREDVNTKMNQRKVKKDI
jgi:hypothetical protein